MTDPRRPSKADKRRARQEATHEEQHVRVSPVQPRTPGQERYLKSIKSNDMTISYGPPGTGKTYVAACYGAELFMVGKIKRFILVRPAVEAGGEKHGFLPGDQNKKLEPWVKPIIDTLKLKLGNARVEQLVKEGLIEVVPFTYMRGRSWDGAYVMLDEAQNTTAAQMKLFTTRIGENCKVIIDGDTEQTDLGRGNTGLDVVIRIAEERRLESVGVVRMTARDIVRSFQCRQWYEGWQWHEGQSSVDNEAPAFLHRSASND